MTTPADPDTAMATSSDPDRYRIIDAACIDELETKVNTLLADGWTLAGGVQVIFDRHPDCQGHTVAEWSFHQAMTR